MADVTFLENLEVEVLGTLRAGKFYEPSRRRLVVDAAGGRDFTTINAAIAYAQSQQTAALERWVIHVMGGMYIEDVEVTREIHLIGEGQMITSITGDTRVHADATIHRIGLYNTTGDYAVLLNCDVAGNIPAIHDCYVYHSHSLNKPAIAVRVTGTAGSSFAMVRNCYLYAQASANHASARAVGVHLTSGSAVYTEVLGGHVKTSNRALASAHVAWNEGAATLLAYVHVEAPWIPSRADGAVVSALYGGNASQYGNGLIFTGDVMPPLLNPPSAITSGGAVCARRFTTAVDTSALNVSTSSEMLGYMDVAEMSPPSVPATNRVRLFAQDNGQGATQYVARFPTGPDAVLATEGGGPRFQSGKYYGSGGVTGFTAGALSGNARACHFHVPVGSATFTGITLDISSAAATSSVRFAIYRDNGYGRPGALAHDLGVLDTSSATGLRELAINVTLTQGHYWLAVAAEVGTITARLFSGVSMLIPQPSTGTLNATNCGYSLTHATGPWEASMGAVFEGTLAPRLLLKAA